MKKDKWTVIFIIIFIIGLSVMLYPTIADQWNKLHQSRAIADYENVVSDMKEEDFEKQWQEAENYNEKIKTNTFSGEVFSQEEKNMRGSEYWSVLNVGDNGIMGYVSIPKIEQKIPIYHGTSDAVLQVGAGHIMGTRLPIGGEGNHSVLAAHRGLPSAKLFTDIDQLKSGDKFYIHILDKVLAYQVDQIFPMIEKDDIEALQDALKNEEGQDYVTLFTCTPYGVNSHRLLVRGHCVAYHGEDDETSTMSDNMLQSVKDYYMLYALTAVAISVLVALGIRIIRNRKSEKRSGREKK
ncbi:class C sortase [Roseburia sp. MSJ-14]|uniref:class C sortase n=1 Tax=Roseburia sp. MSJ-14 TaxID=2841514 RepID=UPI001C11ECD4|nr:class C sortase [Roseburia sp. MSJ-14]MBU5473852.1 class C sortase [Roseburia sp. MSJ-14]